MSKRYRRGIDRRGTLLEVMRRAKQDWFWALRDVSFEIEHGELFGVIGRNGAGKTTLLRILARITRPNEGRVEIRGRVASLMEVGAGFHPELTGTENIFLNGALLGMRRPDVQRRLDAIVDFAGAADFLDTPIKRYSSGMKTRLGFAIAAHLDQEILLVDEVLAVADTAFRVKSMRKIDELTREGRTVLFVGHNMSIIHSHCRRALWLDEGAVCGLGDARDVVHAYVTRSLAIRGDKSGLIPLPSESEVPDTGRIQLTHVRFLDGNNDPVERLSTGALARIAVGYRDLDDPQSDVSLRLTIRRDQQTIASCDSSVVQEAFDTRPRVGEFICSIDRLPLMPGSYSLSLECQLGSELVQRFSDLVMFEIARGDFYATGRLPAPGTGAALLQHEWTIADAVDGQDSRDTPD